MRPVTATFLDRAQGAEDDEAAIKRQARQYQSRLTSKDLVIADLRRQLAFVESIDQANLKAPRWLLPPKRGKSPGAACAALTDTHFDEVVLPAEMFDYNAYDRHIAEVRLRRWADKTVELARDHINGVEWAGLTVFVGGDIFSGTIHEELTETNEDTLYGSVVHWIEQVVAAFRLVADHFGNVHVAVTYGNHGRRTKKPRAKKRAKDNIEWLFWRVVQRELHADKRFTWSIPESMDTFVSVFSTRYQLTHGDQFKGGSGISGVLTPLMLGASRKSRKAMAMGTGFDVLVLGHFHQYLHLPGIIMGGCLKGFDEFASSINVVPEPPTQAFWVTDPKWGVTVVAPLHVGDRKAEGW
jgi:hypothetical protein